MSKTNKLFVAVFVVLLLVIAGEVGYYFWYENNQVGGREGSKSKTQITTNKTSNAMVIIATPTRSMTKKYFGLDSLDLDSSFNFISSWGTFVSGNFQMTHKGKVKKIIFSKDRVEIQLTEYNKNTKNIFPFSYEKSQITVTTDKNTPLEIVDLKENDIIVLTLLWDLKVKKIEAKITKITN